MNDPLEELVAQLNPEERAQITKAEKASEVILANGAEAVKERSLSAEIRSDRDWVLEPQDRARGDAPAMFSSLMSRCCGKGSTLRPPIR